MKKLVVFLMLLAPIALMAQDDKKDTSIDISKGGVIMTEDGIFAIPPDTGIGDSTRTIEVKLGSNGGMQYFDSDKTPKDSQTFKTSWFTMDLGFNNLINESGKLEMPADYEQMELKQGKSLEFSFKFVEGGLNLYRYKLRLVSGVGFTYNNYRFINNIVLDKGVNPLTTYHDSTRAFTKNKFYAKYVTVPLYLNFDSNPFKKNKNFRFALGGEFNYLMNSYQKLKTTTSKTKEEDDYNLEPIRLAAVGRIGYAGFNFFVKYGLTELFKDTQGPKVTPISFGLALASY